MSTPVLNPFKVEWRAAEPREALDASSFTLDYEKSKFDVVELTHSGKHGRLTCCTEPVLSARMKELGVNNRWLFLGRLTISPRSGPQNDFRFHARDADECKRIGLGLWFGFLIGMRAIDVNMFSTFEDADLELPEAS